MDGKYVLAYLDATPVNHPNRGAELSAKRRRTHLGNLTPRIGASYRKPTFQANKVY